MSDFKGAPSLERTTTNQGMGFPHLLGRFRVATRHEGTAVANFRGAEPFQGLF